MYRLVFCDLDGTIITYDRVLRPAVREAMQDVVNADHKYITISSGRGFQLLKPFLPLVVINAPLVCCNGGLIVEPASRRILYVRPMPLALARDVVRWCQREAIEAWVYQDDLDTMLEYRPDEPGAVLRRDGVISARVTNALDAMTSPPHKLIVLPGSVEKVPAVLARLQSYVGGRARVLASSPQVIEVILPEVSKANAMSWVADYLGVRHTETLAIGDGDNDVEMLEWAACGIAMGNATQKAKAAANWIAPSVEEDGAAVALRRFVLQQE
jgi:Cof subfamily protein (haloacid dehalogenase superfamily)